MMLGVWVLDGSSSGALKVGIVCDFESSFYTDRSFKFEQNLNNSRAFGTFKLFIKSN